MKKMETRHHEAGMHNMIPNQNGSFSWVQPPHSWDPSAQYLSGIHGMPPMQQFRIRPAAPLNGIPHNDRMLDSLKHFGSLPQFNNQNNNNKRSKISTTSKTNLYISGLSETDNDETVRALVDGVVEPKSSKAMMQGGKCKGSGFIDCISEEDAEKAKTHIQELAKKTGKKLSVKYAYENEKDVLNVYVRNLPRENFTREMLENMFKEFGQVTSVKLLEGKSGFTGTGFVRFSTPEEAKDAVEKMNACLKCLDADRPVVCKLADKTDPRRGSRGSGRNNLDDLDSPPRTGPQILSNGVGQQSHAAGHFMSLNQAQDFNRMFANLQISGGGPGGAGQTGAPHPLLAAGATAFNPALSPAAASYYGAFAGIPAGPQAGQPGPAYPTAAGMPPSSMYQAGYSMYPSPAAYAAYSNAATAQAQQNQQQQALNADAVHFVPGGRMTQPYQ